MKTVLQNYRFFCSIKMSINSSNFYKRCISRDQSRQNMNKNLNTLFSNQKIAFNKKYQIEFINPKLGLNRKYLNTKAYQQIPLLNGFKRYMSVQVLRQNSTCKYDLIMSKKVQKNEQKQNADKFKSLRRLQKINPQINLTQQNQRDFYNSVKSQNEHQERNLQRNLLSQQSKRLIKSSRKVDTQIMKEMIKGRLWNKQKNLTIKGDRMNYGNGIKSNVYTESTAFRSQSELSSTNSIFIPYHTKTQIKASHN